MAGEDWQAYLRQIAGTDGGLWAFLRATVQLESNGNPNAIGQNKNGTVDRGLLQLNSQYWNAKLPTLAQFDPIRNLAAGTPELIKAYRAAQAQGITGYQLIQTAWINGGHPALATRADGRSTWMSYDAANTPAGVANAVAVMSGTPTSPVPPSTNVQAAPEAAQMQADAAASSGSLWSWITGDFSAIRPAVQVAGWSIAGGLGGLILVILGIYLLGQSLKGSE